MVSTQPQSEVLDDAARNNYTLPWGRKLAVALVPGTALYRIVYEDLKPGPLPDRYSGSYTKVEYAFADISSFVAEANRAAAAERLVVVEPSEEVKVRKQRKPTVEVAA